MALWMLWGIHPQFQTPPSCNSVSLLAWTAAPRVAHPLRLPRQPWSRCPSQQGFHWTQLQRGHVLLAHEPPADGLRGRSGWMWSGEEKLLEVPWVSKVSTAFIGLWFSVFPNFDNWSCISNPSSASLAEAMKPGIWGISLEETHDGCIKGSQDPIEVCLVVDDAHLKATQEGTSKIRNRRSHRFPKRMGHDGPIPHARLWRHGFWELLDAKSENMKKSTQAKWLQAKGACSNQLGFLLRNGGRALRMAPLAHPP